MIVPSSPKTGCRITQVSLAARTQLILHKLNSAGSPADLAWAINLTWKRHFDKSKRQPWLLRDALFRVLPGEALLAVSASLVRGQHAGIGRASEHQLSHRELPHGPQASAFIRAHEPLRAFYTFGHRVVLVLWAGLLSHTIDGLLYLLATVTSPRCCCCFFFFASETSTLLFFYSLRRWLTAVWRVTATLWSWW